LAKVAGRFSFRLPPAWAWSRAEDFLDHGVNRLRRASGAVLASENSLAIGE
jgi:hypothetical protein